MRIRKVTNEKYMKNCHPNRSKQNIFLTKTRRTRDIHQQQISTRKEQIIVHANTQRSAIRKEKMPFRFDKQQ